MQNDQTITVKVQSIMSLIDIIDMFYGDSISTLSHPEQRTELVNAVASLSEAAKSTDPVLANDLLVISRSYSTWVTDADGEEEI